MLDELLGKTEKDVDENRALSKLNEFAKVDFSTANFWIGDTQRRG